jgi:hypothetical protein
MPGPRKNARKSRQKVVAARSVPSALGASIADINNFCDALEASNAAMEQQTQVHSSVPKDLSGEVPHLPRIKPGEFTLRRQPEPPPLQATDLLCCSNTGNAGEVALRWEHVEGNTHYEVQMDDSLAAGLAHWMPYTTTHRHRARVKGLESGRVYRFRVVAVGRAGRGPASHAVPSTPD